MRYPITFRGQVDMNDKSSKAEIVEGLKRLCFLMSGITVKGNDKDIITSYRIEVEGLEE